MHKMIRIHRMQNANRIYRQCKAAVTASKRHQCTKVFKAFKQTYEKKTISLAAKIERKCGAQIFNSAPASLFSHDHMHTHSLCALLASYLFLHLLRIFSLHSAFVSISVDFSSTTQHTALN